MLYITIETNITNKLNTFYVLNERKKKGFDFLIFYMPERISGIILLCYILWRPFVCLSVRTQVTFLDEYPCSFRTDGTCGEKCCLWGAKTLLMGF
jgi:hypothetical protein